MINPFGLGQNGVEVGAGGLGGPGGPPVPFGTGSPARAEPTVTIIAGGV